MSMEDAEQRLQIWSDPENGFASCIGGETPEGWVLTRRPGLINNLLLVWGRVSLQADAADTCHAEVSIGLQPLILYVVVFIALVVAGVFWFLEVELLIALSPLGVMAVVMAFSIGFEDHYLRKAIRKLLTSDP